MGRVEETIDQPPRVSVVVPVKDRRQLLTDLLDALEAQTLRQFEVIVVDDGSTDGSADVARRAVAGRPVVLLDGGGQGAVAARALGVERATAPVLAFTDSDCRPLPAWLEEGVRAIEEGADLVNGWSRPARPMLPLERSMGSGIEGLYPTCNLFFRRDAFDRAGGFDTSVGQRWGFRPDERSRGDGFGEDTLLAWRVARTGAVRYVPDAVVEHHVFAPDYRDMLSRTARVAAFPAMVREVPELRRTLLRHRFELGPRSRLPVYGLVAVLALGRGRPRRPAVLGCLAWWVTLRGRELRRFPLPWRRRLALLPVEMGIDVVTAGALVVGSVRARSVTL